MAMKRWSRLKANMSLRAYDLFDATGDLPEPEWPGLAFLEILKIAFRNYYLDLLLVWSLDRFSREGMAATVLYLQRLATHGVAFRSFTEEHLSTENELVRNILLATLSALAKLEREKISQRTKASLERARAMGKHLGRPKFGDGDLTKLRAALEGGDSWHAVSVATRIPTARSRNTPGRLATSHRDASRARQQKTRMVRADPSAFTSPAIAI